MVSTPDRRNVRPWYYTQENLEKIHHNHTPFDFVLLAWTRAGTTLRNRNGQLQARGLLATASLFQLPFLDVFNNDWG